MSVLRFLCFHCLYKTKMNMMLQHTPDSQKYGLRQGTHSHLPFLDAVFVYCKKMRMSIPPKYIEYFITTMYWCKSQRMHSNFSQEGFYVWHE